MLQTGSTPTSGTMLTLKWSDFDEETRTATIQVCFSQPKLAAHQLYGIETCAV